MNKQKRPSLDNLIADLQLAKEIAIRNENANSLVTATMAQAKLLGIDKGDIIEVNYKPIPSLDLSKLSTEQLRELNAIAIKIEQEY